MRSKFDNTKHLPDGVYIDEWSAPEETKQIGWDTSIWYRRTTNQIFDDFDPPMIPPVSAPISRKIDITDDQFDGDPVLIIPGPFD